MRGSITRDTNQISVSKCYAGLSGLIERHTLLRIKRIFECPNSKSQSPIIISCLPGLPGLPGLMFQND